MRNAEQRLSAGEQQLMQALLEEQLLSPEQVATFRRRAEKPLHRSLIDAECLSANALTALLQSQGRHTLNCAGCKREVILAEGIAHCENCREDSQPDQNLISGILDLIRDSALAVDQAASPKGAPEGLPAGHMLDQFRIVRPLASGGMAVVYEALDTDLDRPVAVKVLSLYGSGTEPLMRLRREARLAAQLTHPNIIRVYQVGISDQNSPDSVHYIAMELVRGRTLAEAVIGRNLRENILLLSYVSKALGHAHQHGVVHRDVKPANILIGEDGKPIVSDFGLARGEEGTTQLTRTGAVMGTPHYMAPEQVQGMISTIGPRTDVWALGVILFQMLTGEQPFQGKTLAEIQSRILEDTPHITSEQKERIPDDLEQICHHALSKEPERRQADGARMATQLDAWLEGQPVIFPTNQRTRWLARQHGIHVAAGLLMIILLFGVFGWWQLRSQNNRQIKDLGRRAQAAYDAGEWDRALALCKQLEVLAGKPLLAPLAQRCAAQITAARDHASQARSSEKQDRKWTLIIRQLTHKLAETRNLFYVPAIDIRAHLATLEKTLSELTPNADQAGTWRGQLLSLLGMGWYLAGRMDRAEKTLLQALTLKPGDGWSNYYLGRIYLDRAMLEFVTLSEQRQMQLSHYWGRQARRFFRQYAQTSESEQPVVQDMVRVFQAWTDRKLQEVQLLCQAALQKHRGSPGTEHFWLMNALTQTPAQLVIDAGKAIQSCPHFAWAFLCRGIAYQLMLKDKVLALRDIEAALRINPYLAPAYNFRGKIRSTTGHIDQAAADYNQAIAYYPKYAQAFLNRGKLRLEQRKMNLARADFNHVIKLDPKSPDGYQQRGILKMRVGHFKEAHKDLTQSLTLAPSGRSYWCRAKIRLQTNDLSGARKDSLEGVRLAPDSWMAWVVRANVLRQCNDLAGTVSALKQAYRMAPAPRRAKLRRRIDRLEQR